jgi:SAM-dependent methyltransferase
LNSDPRHRQAEVAAWFDATYRARGYRYLRPLAAYPILLQVMGARAGQRLLDVGCGPGLLLRAAAQRGVAACGVDIALHGLRLARADGGGPVALANAEALPFARGSFDLVTCVGSLERMLHRERALAEMLRVARPDARFCFLLRNSRSASWRLWNRALRRQEHRAHQAAATLAEWTELFEGNGFAVQAVHADQWFRQRLRRVFRGRPDFSRDEPVVRPWLPLRWALEFLFVLRRREDG